MKRQEYHEVYGFMPEDIINRLSEDDRRKMFIGYMLRIATSTGWFITRAVIAALGDRFINYMLGNIVQALDEDGTPVTKEILVDNMTTQLEAFASDTNTLMEYVRFYREEVLGISDYNFSEEESVEQVKEVMGKDAVTPKTPKRDAKGRFIKNK